MSDRNHNDSANVRWRDLMPIIKEQGDMKVTIECHAQKIENVTSNQTDMKGLLQKLIEKFDKHELDETVFWTESRKDIKALKDKVSNPSISLMNLLSLGVSVALIGGFLITFARFMFR